MGRERGLNVGPWVYTMGVRDVKMEILDKKKPLYHDLQKLPHEPTLKGDSRDRGE